LGHGKLTLPSSAVTGSTGSSRVIGHTNSSAMPFASVLAFFLSLAFSTGASSSSHLRVFTSSRSCAADLVMLKSIAPRCTPSVAPALAGSARCARHV